MAKSLSALLQQSTIEDHEDVLRACNASLERNKNDVDTQHVRFIALLKLDRYDDALKALEEAGDKLKQRAGLEQAYALYKSGNLQEATRIAKGVRNDRGARHVEAQASYRSEDFTLAASLYKELARGIGQDANEDSDIRINSSATNAQLAWNGQEDASQRKKSTREDLEVFMTAYNAACVAVSRGELREGEFLLKTAQDLCAANDELTESEKIAEILPIKVQQVYLLYQLGKIQEAETLASEISVEKIPDAATQQIAQNNLQAVSPHLTNPYASHRLINETSPLTKADRLFSYQSNLVESNGMVLDLLSFKSKAVIKSTERNIARTSPGLSAHINSLSALNAAAHNQSQLGKLGLKQILPLFSKRPTDIGLAMTIIQLYMLTSNPGAATTVLEKLLSNIALSETVSDKDHILNAPGIVALQVSLYGLQHRTSQVKTVLAKASSYWRHKSKSASKSTETRSTQLLHAAGLALVSSTNPEYQSEAREIFSALYSQSADSRFARAGYVAAHAPISSSSPAISPEPKISQVADTLSPLPTLIKGIDIGALEAAGVASRKPASTSSTISGRKRALESDPKSKQAANTSAAQQQQPTKKKRLRRSYLPKDYDPSRTPDLERWLPLRDRSNYRPKGKKGRKKAEDKTQGGAAAGDKAGDGGASTVSTTAAAAPVVSGGGGPGGGKAKGKKKGGRK